RGEDNGDSLGRLLGGQGLGCASGHDDINLERTQFGRKSGEPLELPLGISVFDHDVAALDVTEVTQSLEEGLLQVGASGQVARQVAYSSNLGCLLRLDGEWCGKKCPDGNQELPARHTSHAFPPLERPPESLPLIDRCGSISRSNDRSQ